MINAEDTTYQINLQSQMFIIKDLVIRTLVYGVVCILVIRYFGPEDGPFVISFFVVGYALFDLIPCSVIHAQYFHLNKDAKLIVNRVGRMMTVSYKDSTHSFGFDRIKRVEVSLMTNLYNGATKGWALWEVYNYAVIEIEDGERFVITLLMVNNLVSFFESLGLHVKKERMYFPWIDE